MYRRLDPAFRAAYCRLWRGMILSQPTAVTEAAKELGLAEFAEVQSAVVKPNLVGSLTTLHAQELPLLFIYRPVTGGAEGAARVGGMTTAERQRLRNKYKGLGRGDVSTSPHNAAQAAANLPSPLLSSGEQLSSKAP